MNKVGEKPVKKIEKEYVKGKYCSNCKAYEFHQWLKGNNYKITKEVSNGC